MKITFAGGYGMKSYGDDAPLIALAQKFKNKYANCECVVIDRHADEKSYDKYGLKSIQNIEYPSKKESIGKWFRGFNYSDKRDILKCISKEIKSSDLLIVGPGNLFVDYTIDLFRGHIPHYSIYVILAKMYRVPIMLYGLSFIPFKTEYGYYLTRMVLDFADVITVRDNLSIDVLLEMGINRNNVIELPDSALGLDIENSLLNDSSERQEIKKLPKPILAIAVRDLSFLGNELNDNYLSTFSEICDEFIESTNGSVIFVPQCIYEHGDIFEDDRYVSKLIKNKMKNTKSVLLLEKEYDIFQTISFYKLCDICLATRLHGNVFSAIAGTPPIGINYNDKVKGFMRKIDKEEYCIDLEFFTTETVLDKCTFILKNKQKIENQIQEKIIENMIAVNEYFDLASNLCRGDTN